MLEAELAKRIEAKVRAALTERILREADLERQVADAIAEDQDAEGGNAGEGHQASCSKREPKREWRDHIEAVAKAKTKARS